MTKWCFMVENFWVKRTSPVTGTVIKKFDVQPVLYEGTIGDGIKLLARYAEVFLEVFASGDQTEAGWFRFLGVSKLSDDTDQRDLEGLGVFTLTADTIAELELFRG